MAELSKRKWLILGAVWAVTAVIVWPVIFHWTAADPSRRATEVAAALAAVAAAVLCWLIYRTELKRSDRSKSIGVVVLVLVVTVTAFYIHKTLIDYGSHFHDLTNAAWQESLQNQVVRLSPTVLPHSYRFLPNAVVFWMQILRVQFTTASDIYRILAGILLFYAIYRYARLYTSHLGGLIAVVLSGLIYPVSFVGYAGQLTDPLSHLSFVLAFIFLETDDFLFFLTALLIGSLAKETVLGMLGFYVLFKRKDEHYLLKSAVVCASCLGAYFGVRMLVLHGNMQYQEVSGVGHHHIFVNLGTPVWPYHFASTVGAYIPFLILGWKDTPASLKKMVFYLLPLLFISSAFFSWLNEARNFMPLVFVLAVITGRYLIGQASSSDGSSYRDRPQNSATEGTLQERDERGYVEAVVKTA